MTNDKIVTKNKKTKNTEIINQYDIEIVGWGMHFFVDGELEAFKAAYQYRNNPHGVKVEYAAGVGRWQVTVFNETAKDARIDTGK